MQARGRSPLDCLAPLVARARAAATPLHLRSVHLITCIRNGRPRAAAAAAPLPARFEAAA